MCVSVCIYIHKHYLIKNFLDMSLSFHCDNIMGGKHYSKLNDKLILNITKAHLGIISAE